MELLEWLRSETGAPQENEVTQRIYASLPNSSFSSEVLEKAPEFLRVMELNDVEWSDWGRPERIAQSIQWLGRKPAFPLDLLQPDSHQKGSRVGPPTSRDPLCRAQA
jgi:mannose-1-phosphate guanylyltransferase